MSRILAIDPGSRWCAIVARDTHADRDLSVAYSTVLDRHEHDDHGRELPLEGWVRLVVDVTVDAAAAVTPDHIAVEAATAPGGHAQGRSGHIINPASIIETAAVVGGIVTAFTNAVIVPAGAYGAPVPNRRVLLAAYPAELVGPRETTGSGKSRRQHARAAWDMAQAATPHLNSR